MRLCKPGVLFFFPPQHLTALLDFFSKSSNIAVEKQSA